MGKAVKREEPHTPVGLAGSHLNVLNVAMERLGLRNQMRENGPVVFPGSSASAGGEGNSSQPTTRRAKILQAKCALDKAVIEIITSGQWERLEPNSGKSVAIGNHHVCVSYDEQMEVGYRTWEWHGHMLMFDEEDSMYRPEYAYGNYFEPLDGGVMKIGANIGKDPFMFLLNNQFRF